MATTTAVTPTTSTTNAGTYASAAFTPANNDLLIVFVVASGTVAAGIMTGTGVSSFTKVTSALFAVSANTVYAFIANGLVKAASQTVTFDCSSGGSASGAAVMPFRIAGMSRSGLNAIRQSITQANQAAAGTPTPTFGSSCLTGNVTLSCVGNSTSPATLTTAVGWTEAAGEDVGYATPTTGADAIFRDSGFTGTAVTWGSTSATAFGDIAIELDTTALEYIGFISSELESGGFVGRVFK